jgi:hypothetical protein
LRDDVVKKGMKFSLTLSRTLAAISVVASSSPRSAPLPSKSKNIAELILGPRRMRRAANARRFVRSERELKERIAKLHERLQETQKNFHLTPAEYVRLSKQRWKSKRKETPAKAGGASRGSYSYRPYAARSANSAGDYTICVMPYTVCVIPSGVHSSSASTRPMANGDLARHV